VLYYPQLLGLALGFSPDELGFRLNRVKARDILRRLSKREPSQAET
jgi:heterodisulfide reductase subunit B